jgi:MFS transporter, DHA2 family, multidrug resistance protein
VSAAPDTASSSAPAAVPAVNPWIVAVAVMFATFMEVLDSTVVNVSLPHIAGNLSATIEESTWVLTSYLVANAIILPLTGWLATWFGRKRLLLFSVSGFTVASVLCGLAPTLPMLVLCRLIQGATGGAMQPLSQAVLLEAFRPEDRGKAMGFWGLGIVVAPILGPVLGGWLTDSYSWRWVFYINLPVGITSLVMTWLYVFDPPYLKRASNRIDYWGIGLLAVWIGALQIVLDLGQRHDWFASPFITTMAVVAVGTLAAFLIYEWRIDDPVVDLRVFTLRTYATGVALMAIVGFVLYGSLVLLPILLQTLLGYPALEAGIAMAPRGLGAFIGMPAVGLLIGRFDPRKMVAMGLVVGGGTLLWLGTLNLNAGYWDIFWPQFVQGLALSLLFVPLTTIAMDPIPRERMGNATSLFNLTRNLGGSVGIAMTSTLLSRYEQTNAVLLGSHVTALDPAARSALDAARSSFLASGSDPVTATQRAYAVLDGIVHQQAAIVSFVSLFRGLGILFVLLVPLVLLMRRPRAGKGPVGAH